MVVATNPARVRPSKADRRRARQEETAKLQAKVSPVQGKTPGQVAYLESIRRNDVTVAVGPAGTGKTYIPASYAAQMLAAGQIRQVILCRALVEGGGEKLGFLPGEVEDKLAPWTAEIMRVLSDKLGRGRVQQLADADLIRTVPFAFMRGHTWDDAFVILTEAQNTTVEQMKLFTTRFGTNCKVVIEGDDDQTDLEDDEVTGLDAIGHIITGRIMHGCGITILTEDDIVRSAQTRQWVDGWAHFQRGLLPPTEYAD